MMNLCCSCFKGRCNFGGRSNSVYDAPAPAPALLTAPTVPVPALLSAPTEPAPAPALAISSVLSESELPGSVPKPAALLTVPTAPLPAPLPAAAAALLTAPTVPAPEPKPAAIKIQSQFRGYHARKSLKKQEAAAIKIQKVVRKVNERKLALAAVTENGLSLKNVSAELQGDPGIVWEAVLRYGCALQFAAEKVKSDKEVVLAAVSQDGNALEFASASLQGDRDFVLTVVARNGCALQFASAELKRDPEFILEAVSRNGFALRTASEEWKGDRRIVLAVVVQDENVLEYASAALQEDRDFVLAVVAENGNALEFASEKLKTNSALEEFSKMADRDRKEKLPDVQSAFKLGQFDPPLAQSKRRLALAKALITDEKKPVATLAPDLLGRIGGNLQSSNISHIKNNNKGE